MYILYWEIINYLSACGYISVDNRAKSLTNSMIVCCFEDVLQDESFKLDESFSNSFVDELSKVGVLLELEFCAR